MSNTTQFYTIVTQEGDLAIAGNTTYIVDRYIPVYDFRLDNNLDSRLLRAKKQAGVENLVDYMMDTWGEVYNDNGTPSPLSHQDVFLWNTQSSSIDWTYGIANSFIGQAQGGFSIGDSEIWDNTDPINPVLLQPKTEIGNPPSNLEGLAGYSLGDVLYSPNALNPTEDKFFNANMFIANSTSPDENAVRVVSDNGIFPDDDAYLITDGGYTQPTVIDTYSKFNGDATYGLSQEQADAICYRNVESYQTVLTDDATDQQIPGFKFNIKFNQDVGSIKFNKFILFGINTEFDSVTGTCKKVGEYFPFAVTVLPITQLKTNIIGYGIEEFNLNTQIIISRSGYNNDQLVLDNCCWTKLDKYQTLGNSTDDGCVTSLPGCGPNSATLAWDKNVYIGTKSTDIFINKESEIAKLLISDGGPFITYDTDLSSPGGIIDLQKPQIALGNKNLGESTIDVNRSYWLWSFIGENDQEDSHDLILMPKNTKDEYLSDYAVEYGTDGGPVGVDPSDPGVFVSHPFTQSVVPNTSWNLLGGDQSVVNTNKLFPAISLGKENKIFNEIFTSSVRVNQIRTLPTSDYTTNNLFIHNLPVTSTGWPLGHQYYTGTTVYNDTLPSFNGNDIVIVAKNDIILGGNKIVIPHPASLEVLKITGLSELVAESEFLNEHSLLNNQFGISFQELKYVDEVDNLAVGSKTILNFRGRETDAVLTEQYSTDIKINMVIDGTDQGYSATDADIFNGIIINAETTDSLNMGDTNPYIDIFNLRNLYANDSNKFFNMSSAGLEFSEKIFKDVDTTEIDSAITLFTKSRWVESNVAQGSLTLGINIEPNTIINHTSSPSVIMSSELNIVPTYDTTKINIFDIGTLNFNGDALLISDENITLSAWKDNVSVELYENIIHQDSEPGYETDARSYNTKIDMYSFVSENGIIVDEYNVGIEFSPTGYFDVTSDEAFTQVYLYNQVDIRPTQGTDTINLINLGTINSKDNISINSNNSNSSINLLSTVIFEDAETLIQGYVTDINSKAVWEEVGNIQSELEVGVRFIPNMYHIDGSGSLPGVASTNAINIEPTSNTDSINLRFIDLITNSTNEYSNINFINEFIVDDPSLGTITNHSIVLSSYGVSKDINDIIIDAAIQGIILEPSPSYLDTDSIATNDINIAPADGTDGINLIGVRSINFLTDMLFTSDDGVQLSGYNSKAVLGLTETVLYQDTDTDLRVYNMELNLVSIWSEYGSFVQQKNVGLKFVPTGAKVPGSDPGVILYDEIDIRSTSDTSMINILDVGYIAGNNQDVLYDNLFDEKIISYNTRILSTVDYIVNGSVLDDDTAGIDIGYYAYYNNSSALPALTNMAVIKASPNTNGIMLADVKSINSTNDIIIDAPNVTMVSDQIYMSCNDSISISSDNNVEIKSTNGTLVINIGGVDYEGSVNGGTLEFNRIS